MGEDKGHAQRVSPLEIAPERFRELGYQLVDRVAGFLDSLPERAVTPGESPAVVRQVLGAERTLPQQGDDPALLLNRAADLLFDHSLFNGHPRFWGYVTSSAAPLGALAEMLAAAVNPNVGAWPLSPMASEIEAQTVRWIAELLDYPTDCGRPVRKRRKHGQLRLLSGCAPGQGRPRSAQSGSGRPAHARLLLH